jgi:uncharacterized protein YxjI
METYELTQKVLSFGPAYEARRTDRAEPPIAIKGKILTVSPRLSMLGGESGGEVASLAGNFSKTKFDCFDAQKNCIATLRFPLFAIKKGFTIDVSASAGGAARQYKADGGFLGGAFECKNAAGEVVMRIAKQLSIREKFEVTTTGELPRDVALMAAVAIDQKFFRDD